MTTLRRSLGLLAIALAVVLGLSAVTATADAYPPGQKAHITLSATRVSHGSTLTITGQDFRPQGHVVITVTCRQSSPKKTFTKVYRDKAVDGQFSKTITIDSSYPSGRCIVTVNTGKRAENSDRATFFVNQPGQSSQAVHSTRLAGFDSTTPVTTAGSGSDVGGLLIAGFGLVFLLGGGVLLFTSRRRYAVVSN